MPRPLRSQLVLAGSLTLLAACAEVRRERSTSPLQRSEVVAHGRVLADTGGTVRVDPLAKAHTGIRITFPAGALTVDTEVEIIVHYGDARFPSVVQTVEVGPVGLVLERPAELTIEYDEQYSLLMQDIWSEQDIQLYSFVKDPAIDERAHAVGTRSPDDNLIRASVDRLGTFVALHRTLHDMIGPPARLLDPSMPLRAELIDGRPRLSESGRITARLGKGSLESFWLSPTARNLLVVPGQLSDPLVLASPASFLSPESGENLLGDFDNVVVFTYPPGRSLRGSANLLYDEIVRHAGPGFGCRILAHGSGGLVTRYAIELSNRDASRTGFTADDPRLDTFIDRAILVATPNQGSTLSQSRYADLFRVVPDHDIRFAQGLLDLLPLPDGLVAQLGADWQAPATRYFAVAGDVAGFQNDGLVDVVSAIALPQPFTRLDAHLVFSGPIYEHDALLVFGARTGVLQQIREWLDLNSTRTPPIVGGLATGSGVLADIVDVQLKVANRQRRPVTLLAAFSRDLREWQFATANPGSAAYSVPSASAPGEPHVFPWDTVADRIGLDGPERVVLRLVPVDEIGMGTAGETGWIRIDNSR